MPRNSSGQYTQPANTAAVASTTISSSAFNSLVSDVGAEITNSLDRNGRSAMTAALPMGSNKITGMADPAVSTDGATKGYVDTTTASFFSTGDIKLTWKTVADTGWILHDDGTIGNAASNATTRANADTSPLFALTWTNFNNTKCPVYNSDGTTSTRGLTAAADYAANKRIQLPIGLGRVPGIAGAGSGLTSRALGDTAGEETHLLTAAELPAAPITGTAAAASNEFVNSNGGGATGTGSGAGFNTFPTTSFTPAAARAVTGTITGGGGSHNNMQPTAFWNVMVKL